MKINLIHSIFIPDPNFGANMELPTWIYIEEELEKLFPNYRSVDTDGSYFHLWVPFTVAGIEALPQFHIIISTEESGSLCLRLLTYHGKELLRNKVESIEEWKKGTAKNMLSKLSLCSGIPFGADITHGNFAELRREPLKDKVVIRSVECSYAVPACSKLEEYEIVSCDECLQLARSRSHQTENSKTLVTKSEDQKEESDSEDIVFSPDSKEDDVSDNETPVDKDHDSESLHSIFNDEASDSKTETQQSK